MGAKHRIDFDREESFNLAPYVAVLGVILVCFGAVWATGKALELCLVAAHVLLSLFGRWIAYLVLLYVGSAVAYKWRSHRMLSRWNDNLDGMLKAINKHFIDPSRCCIILSGGSGNSLRRSQTARSRSGSIINPVETLWMSGVAGTDLQFFVQAMTRAGTIAVFEDHGFVTTVTGAVDIPATIEYISGTAEAPGRYSVTFSPRKAGVYVVHVSHNDRVINGSGFKCVVGASVLHPASCTARGPGVGPLPLSMDREYAIKLETRDQFGNMLTEGGNQHMLSFEYTGHCYARIEDKEDGTYHLCYSPLAPGYFEGRIQYDGVVAAGGSFRSIVLGTTRRLLLDRLVDSGKAVFRGVIHHDKDEDEADEEDGADLSRFAGRFSARLTLTPHRILIHKKTNLGLMSKSIYVMKMRHSIKITPKGAGGLAVVDDGMNIFNIELEDRNLFYAVAMVFMYDNKITADEPFKSRRAFLHTELKELHQQEFNNVMQWNKPIQVSAHQALKHGILATSAFSAKQWRQRFHVVVADTGEKEALGREEAEALFFNSCEEELFSPANGLFTSKACAGKSLLQPQPYQYGRLSHFKFAGLLLAKSIYDTAVYSTERPVAVSLSLAMHKHIVGLPAQSSDLRADDPEFYAKRVEPVIFHDEGNDDPIYFTETEQRPGQPDKMVPLVPNGQSIKVTEENKQRYLTILSQYVTYRRVQKQVDAILEGFYSLIPEHLVSLFDEAELGFLLGGVPLINVDNLRWTASYGGWFSCDSPVVRWFWDALRCGSPEFRARVVHLITGSIQEPPTGWEKLTPPMTLWPAAPKGTRGKRPPRIPYSDPSCNTVFLDEYCSFEELRTSMLMSLGLLTTVEE